MKKYFALVFAALLIPAFVIAQIAPQSVEGPISTLSPVLGPLNLTTQNTCQVSIDGNFNGHIRPWFNPGSGWVQAKTPAGNLIDIINPGAIVTASVPTPSPSSSPKVELIGQLQNGAPHAQLYCNATGATTSSGTTPTPFPTICPSPGTNISVTGTYPCTIANTAPTPCPSPGTNITVTSTYPCTINSASGTPIYTTNGSAPATGFHGATFTVSYSGTCANNALCDVTIPTFTGSAAFTNITALACTASSGQANAPSLFGTMFVLYVSAGPNLEVVFQNVSGGNLLAATFQGMCWGS